MCLLYLVLVWCINLLLRLLPCYPAMIACADGLSITFPITFIWPLNHPYPTINLY